MRKLSLLIAMFLCIGLTYAQDSKLTLYRGHKAIKGKMRIKFKGTKQIVSKLDKLQQQRGEKGKISRNNSSVIEILDFPELTSRNQQYKAVSMKRVFRPAGKHEAKHRAWGLHLWYELEVDKNAKLSNVLEAYSQIAELEVVEPEYQMSLSELSGEPNDPQYSSQKGHYDLVNAAQAWGVETGHSAVVVAIEDGGVDFDHPDLAGNMWINSGEIRNNGVDDDNNGYVDDYFGYNFGDNQGEIAVGSHGTHVAGTVAAETNNGVGVAGLAGGSGSNDGIRLMSLSTFGGSSQGGFDEAFIYAADNGAHISQNSWGGGGQSTVLENAIDYFIANAGGADQALNGGLVVFAAGNDNSSSTTSGYPASYAPVIAVASTTHSGVRSSFSNYGSWVDIAAPGSSILSTYPNSNYNSISGTSMACPHVSGVAALVASKSYREGTTLTAAQLRSTLESSANTDLLYSNNGSYTGQLGSGMLDAYAALTGDIAPPPPTSYCVSKGNSVADEYISRVQLGSIDNASDGGNGYSDHTNISTDLEINSNNTITITPTWTGTVYDEGYAVWIDYDRDTTFSASELVWSAAASQNTPVSGSFTVPTGVLTGATRMRVSMKYDGIPTSCESFSYGEVEDYTVNITTGGSDTQAPTAPSNLSSSNITQTSVDLSWTASTDNVGVTGYDVYQDGNLAGSVSGASYSVTGLTAATTYSFYVRAKDAAGNVSSNSNSLSITTDPTVGECYASAVTLTLTTDNYASETTWTLQDGNGNTVASNGSLENNSTYTESFNLNDGDYTFTINDSYGDGICCNYGNGSYSLTDGNGVAIVSGGSFSSSESTSFCISGGGTDPDPVCGNIFGIAAPEAQWDYFTYEVPVGATSLDINISGGSGDADLYIKFGSQPTLSDYDCRPYVNGNEESCSFSNPAPGTWHIGLRAYNEYAGVNLQVCYQGSSTASITSTSTNKVVFDSEVMSEANVSAFPNPAYNLLNINLGIEVQENARISIYSLSGVEMMRIPVGSLRNGINISKLPKGMYLIKVPDQNKGMITTKFIKK